MEQVLTLKPNVFLWTNDKQALLYNCETFNSIVFALTPSIKEMCNDFNNIDNLYSIFYHDNGSDTPLSKFVKEILSWGFGVLHNKEDGIISLPPVLNLQNNWEKVIKEDNQSTSKILNYLSVITIYLGGYNLDNNNIYMQTEYPIPGNCIIDINKLTQFLERIATTYVKSIRFVVCNLANNPDIANIFTLISSLDHKASIYIKSDELSNVTVRTMIKNSNVPIIALYHDAYSRFFYTGNIHHRFLIENEDEFLRYTKLIEESGLSNYDFVPVYNGHNRNFIINSVFPTQEELLQTKLKKRHIFMHQVVNVSSFGHLFVLPSGQVYSDLNRNAIGSINDKPHKLIIAELNANYSWRRTRRTNGCGNCLFVDLCPSPIKLEDIMGVQCVCADFNR